MGGLEMSLLLGGSSRESSNAKIRTALLETIVLR